MTNNIQASYRRLVNQITCSRLCDALRAINLKNPIEAILYEEPAENDAEVRILYKAGNKYSIDVGSKTLAMLTDIVNYLIEDEGPSELKNSAVHGDAPIDKYLCKVLELTDEGCDVVNMALWHAPEESLMSFQIADVGRWYTTRVSDDGLLMIRDVCRTARLNPKFQRIQS